MFILIQVLNIWPLEFTYLVYKLTWNSHVVYIDKVLVLLNKKDTIMFHCFLYIWWLILLKKLHYLLCSKNLISIRIIGNLNEELKSLCAKCGVYLEVVFIGTVLQETIPYHEHSLSHFFFLYFIHCTYVVLFRFNLCCNT